MKNCSNCFPLFLIVVRYLSHHLWKSATKCVLSIIRNKIFVYMVVLFLNIALILTETSRCILHRSDEYGVKGALLLYVDTSEMRHILFIACLRLFTKWCFTYRQKYLQDSNRESFSTEKAQVIIINNTLDVYVYYCEPVILLTKKVLKLWRPLEKYSSKHSSLVWFMFC